MFVEAVTFFGVKLDNPVTPWVVLALTGAAWLALYLFAAAEGDA